MSRYANKRIHMRTSGGQFRKATMQDFGIGGVCPAPGCRHFLLRHYDGDPRELIDPRKFEYRCFTCKPLTQAEQDLQAEIEASKPKPKSIIDIIMAAEQSAPA